MGKLTPQNHEAWRTGKVPYLERVITVNLAKISVLLRALHANCLKGNLRPSLTAYTSWGTGKKRTLHFSKSGDPNVERAYATHYLRPKPIATTPDDTKTLPMESSEPKAPDQTLP
jgi:hypothetical protein